MEKESPELYEDFLPKWIIYYGKPIPSDQPTSAPTGLFLHSKYELPSSPNITDDAYGELDHHLYPVHHTHRDPIYYETRQQFELDHSPLPHFPLPADQYDNQQPLHDIKPSIHHPCQSEIPTTSHSVLDDHPHDELSLIHRPVFKYSQPIHTPQTSTSSSTLKQSNTNDTTLDGCQKSVIKYLRH